MASTYIATSTQHGSVGVECERLDDNSIVVCIMDVANVYARLVVEPGGDLLFAWDGKTKMRNLGAIHRRGK